MLCSLRGLRPWGLYVDADDYYKSNLKLHGLLLQDSYSCNICVLLVVYIYTVSRERTHFVFVHNIAKL